MEIRDPIHGAIEIQKPELPLLDSKHFQRLRHIRQLGFAEYAFPSAIHNRYLHSLGTMHVALLLWKQILSHFQKPLRKKLERFSLPLKIAALLHDLGHGPLSHSIEPAMPPVQKLLPWGRFRHQKTLSQHEHYTLKILIDSSLTPLLDRFQSTDGFGAKHIATLLGKPFPKTSIFFQETFDGETVSFLPILQQIISSELDADRMDYLLRDSHFAGVSYGHFDLHWIMKHLKFHIEKKSCYLALHHRALYAFEDFLISRYHMFLMVYFHYKNIVFDRMLETYLKDPQTQYQLPLDMEDYLNYDDNHLWQHLKKHLHNTWAQRIIKKNPFALLVEWHTGIPNTPKANQIQEKAFQVLKEKLQAQNIPFLEATSTSQFSKYFGKAKDPIFVHYSNHLFPSQSIPLESCTDLFQRYQKTRRIGRLYVPPQKWSEARSFSEKSQHFFPSETSPSV